RGVGVTQHHAQTAGVVTVLSGHFHAGGGDLGTRIGRRAGDRVVEVLNLDVATVFGDELDLVLLHAQLGGDAGLGGLAVDRVGQVGEVLGVGDVGRDVLAVEVEGN